MSTTGLRTICLVPKQWDRIMAALAFAADHSRDFCTRENNLLLVEELEKRLDRNNDEERARLARRRYRERKSKQVTHDPDANNLEFGTRHPLEVR
jgi:hypothetical protein